MKSRLLVAAIPGLMAALWLAAPAHAQDPQARTVEESVCPEPSRLPPVGAPVLYRCMEFRFYPTNDPIVPSETYVTHLQTLPSNPAREDWVAYDEENVQADFWNLWNTDFLDDLWVEVRDEPFENGVGGKHVIFHMEERSRVKFVDYVGSDRVGINDIEEALRDRGASIRIDSFVDLAAVGQVIGIVKDLYAAEGYNDATVEVTMPELAGGPKLVQLVFDVDEGPKYRIREIAFDGNDAFSDGKLRGKMKENRQKGWLSFITGSGNYKADLFADDADQIETFYLNEGYARVLVGTPQLETLEDSEDGSERWIRMRIPVDEGAKFRIGEFRVEGNDTVQPEFLLEQFKIKPGDYFDRSKIDDGIEKVQQIYGQLGFWQWTPLPSLEFPTDDPATPADETLGDHGEPLVNLVLGMDEGDQFFVNRITFTGNTTTHDVVIRREMRIQEGGVFNVNALQTSVQRLNQLGYFQPFEGTDDEMQVEEVPGVTGRVDVTLNVVEQNRNQITFGAGVSQFDGFFFQLSYQTANFLGRGETLGVQLQRGRFSNNYVVSFTEPWMWDRPITLGASVFRQGFEFPFQFSQRTTGTSVTLGLPATDWSRFFISYSYQNVRVFDISEAFLTPQALAFNPLLVDSLLLATDGERRVSRISPSWVYNTVNQPLFPSSGSRLTLAGDLAGLGGNTKFYQGRVEGIYYRPLIRSGRMSIGGRLQVRYITPFGSTETLPIFEKYFLGGEFDIRGFDLRTISPRDPRTGLQTGGNKAIVFNAEYAIDVVPRYARLIAFFDAGQVQDRGTSFRIKDPVVVQLPAGQIVPTLTDPFVVAPLLAPLDTPLPDRSIRIGEVSAFKMSTGFEMRIFMPIVNVPFRLIGAYNPTRLGVLTHRGIQTPQFNFRFAIGTMF